MLLLAESATTLTKLQSVPNKVWLMLGGAVLALILLVIVLRKLAKTNKVIIAVVAFLVVTFIGFNWIYQRNEPSWATPVISKLAQFFPTKGMMK
jgi:apolipoprotein N-acyltransferase